MQTLFENFNLTNGLNLGVSKYLNKPGEAREVLNCDLSIPGELGRLPGYEVYGSGLASDDVTSVYDFKSINGDITKWLAVADTSIYYDNAGTWTASDLTNLTADTVGTFATHLDTVIYSNGVDVMKKSTNGQNWSNLGGTPPKAKYIVTFDNKVYALNLENDESAMRWTDDGTIETWDDGGDVINIQDIATNIGVGDEITGATVNNNNLIITKNYSVWKWDTAELRVLHSSVGNRAPRSLVTIDDWTFMLGHKGIMATNGGKPFRISKPIKPFVDAIADITTPIGWADNNIYYLFVGNVTVLGKTYTNCVFIYDHDNVSWDIGTLANVVKSVGILTTAAGSRSVYIGSNAGAVYKLMTGLTQNSTPIPWRWTDAPQMSGYPHLRKDYKYFYVFLEDSTENGIDVFFSVDGKDPIALGTAKDSVSELVFPPGTRGFNIVISYATNTTGEQKKILGHLCLGDIMEGRLGSVR